MLARDQGTPQKTGTTTVRVIIERNTYTPVFQYKDTYSKTIAVTYTPSLTVLRVSAVDRDPEVSSYTLLQYPQYKFTVSRLGFEQNSGYYILSIHLLNEVKENGDQ